METTFGKRTSAWVSLLCVAYCVLGGAVYGEAVERRKLIPTENGESVVAPYSQVLSSVEPAAIAEWAKFHNGWEEGTDNCAHWRAEFLIWHHAYLVLTEELFSLVTAPNRFQMPFWSPAQGAMVPSVFRCASDDPRCRPLKDSHRYEDGYPLFSEENAAWQRVLTKGANSFFCLNPDGIKELGGQFTSATSRRPGFLEESVHEPVHAKSTGALKVPETAASDPLFQPFHAGIDAMLLNLIEKSPRFRCELCAGLAAGPDDSSVLRSWKSIPLHVLPEPQCLAYRSATQDFTVLNDKIVADAGVSKRCGDFSKKNGIPYTTFKVGDIVREPRFWKAAYEGGMETSLRPPCEDLKACTFFDEDGDFTCPSIHRTRSLILSKNRRGTEDVFIPEGERSGEVVFRLRLDGILWGADKRSLFRVILKSGTDRIELGRIQYSPWRESFNKHHGDHDESLVISIDGTTSKKLSSFLKTTNVSQLSVHFLRSDNKEKKEPNARAIRLDEYVLDANAYAEAAALSPRPKSR